MTTSHNKTFEEKISDIKKKVPQKQLVLTICAIVLVFAILIYSITVALIRYGKIAVEVVVAPYSSSLELNGTKIKNRKKIYLEEGNYHLSASAEHFDTREMDVKITKDCHYIGAILVPNDPEGQEYQENHYIQFRNAEGIIGIAINAEGKARREKYPILKYLPINNSIYSISYTEVEEERPVVTIKTDLSYLDIAVSKLKTFENVSLVDYEINTNIPKIFTITRSSDPDIERLAKSVIPKAEHSLQSIEQLNDNYAVAIYTRKDPESLLQNGKYLMLIEKKEESWTIISEPQAIFTRYNTENIPTDILNMANNFAGQ